MRRSSLSFSLAATALLTAVLFAVTTLAQAPPQGPPPGGSPPPGGGPPFGQPRDFPAPTNLKVLPKNLTGQQVRDIMEKWEGSLGAHCNTCHAEDPKNIGPNGRPRLNFADDSKQQKATARMMFQMTQDIDKNYVSKVPSSDAMVSCGTCHRGHLDPEEFVIPKEDRPWPPPGGQPPAGTPPGGPPPPSR